MNCWTCKDQELIWGGDHDLEDESDAYSIVSNFSCPKCEAHVEFYTPREIDDFINDRSQ